MGGGVLTATFTKSYIFKYSYSSAFEVPYSAVYLFILRILYYTIYTPLFYATAYFEKYPRLHRLSPAEFISSLLHNEKRSMLFKCYRRIDMTDFVQKLTTVISVKVKSLRKC